MDLFVIRYISPVFYQILELSIAAVCIGLGVLLLRKLADKRIPPIWKNALWLLVLVALVVPYRPSSNVAVIPSAEVNFRQQETILTTEITQEKTELDGVYQVPSELTQQREELHAKSLIFEVIIPAVWLLGMVVMMGILLATRKKMLRGLRTTTGRPYDVLLADCKRQLNITQTVEILEQSYLKSPALWGLFHPKILLPDYVAEMSEDSQKYILLHELSHLKHCDLWKNTLLLALQIVYWFNPLVWVLFRFIRQDMELLNDERVLKTLQKSEETPYAMSLIEVLGHSNKLPLAPQMLCMVDNKDNTKRRIQMIQLGEVFKKQRILIAVGCLAVIGVLSALFLTSQASPLHWAHTLNKDDIEKVELYWMEEGQEDTTYLLDENQRATLCIMLNNLYGEETENVPPSQGKSAQYSIYLTDGTVETISFLPLNEEACFFRLGWDGFMGDEYQKDDWMGLTEGVTTQNVVVEVKTSSIDTLIPELLDEIEGQDFIGRADFTLDGSNYTLHISTETSGDALHGMAEVFDDTTTGEEGSAENFYYSTMVKVLKKREGGAATADMGVLTPEGEEIYYLAVHTYDSTDLETLSRLISDACNQVAEVKLSSAEVTSDPWGITLTATDVTSTLSIDDSEMIQQLLDITKASGDWFSAAVEITPDVQITSAKGDILMYESKSGTLVNTTQNQSVILDYEAKIGLNEVLGRYGTLESTSSELVGDPQPLTADQLAYFNDTYFNGATGQNFNLANQFLHNPFDLPINIDLSMLFYHGAGADYAMSEDGEYDAVAQTYGFDSWADIPTDVTAIPKASMDDMLEQYTGIDLFASKKIGLDQFKYLEEYDCYYNLHGDTNYYGDVEFVLGTQTGDRIALSYYNSWQQADYILTLVDYGGGDYKIYSNLPAIIEE